MNKDFWNSFFYTYNLLKLDEKKEFFKVIIDEIKKNSNIDDYIENLLKELKATKEEIQQDNKIEQAITLKDFLEDFQKEIEITNDKQKQELQDFVKSIQKEFEDLQTSDLVFKESNEKKFVLPIAWNIFDEKIIHFGNQILKNHQEDLEKIGIFKEEEIFDNTIKVFGRENLVSQEKLAELKKDFINTYIQQVQENTGLKIDLVGMNQNDDAIIALKTEMNQEQFLSLIKNNFNPEKIEWNKVLSIDEIKRENEIGENFINLFAQDCQEIMQSNTIENQKLNNLIEENENTIKETPLQNIHNTPKENTKVLENNKKQSISQPEEKKPWLTWLEDIKLQNHNLAMTKDMFKKRFFEYCKNGMDDDELKILIILKDKTPSKLSLEHREMIEKGIQISFEGNKILNDDLRLAAKVFNEKKSNPEEVSKTKTFLQGLESNTLNQQFSKAIDRNLQHKKQENTRKK